MSVRWREEGVPVLHHVTCSVAACLVASSAAFLDFSASSCDMFAVKGLPGILLVQCFESMLRFSDVGELCICTLSVQVRLALRRAQKGSRPYGSLAYDI